MYLCYPTSVMMIRSLLMTDRFYPLPHRSYHVFLFHSDFILCDLFEILANICWIDQAIKLAQLGRQLWNEIVVVKVRVHSWLKNLLIWLWWVWLAEQHKPVFISNLYELISVYQIKTEGSFQQVWLIPHHTRTLMIFEGTMVLDWKKPQ